MLAIVKSPELIEILNTDPVLASRFDWAEGFDSCYVSIRNVVDVLDNHGLQLKLEREGIDLILSTAGVQNANQ